MDTINEKQATELRGLIGSIVLITQDIERYLKVVTPFMGDDESEVDKNLARLDKIKKQTFGQLLGAFLNKVKFEPNDAKKRMNDMIAMRNNLVHHFSETYGPQIKAGETDKVITTLRTHRRNAIYLRDALEQLTRQLIELLRES